MKTQLHGNFDFQDQKVEHSQLPISSEASSAKAEVSQTQIKESELPPTIISSEDSSTKAEVSRTHLTESDPRVTYSLSIPEILAEVGSWVRWQHIITIVISVLIFILALVRGGP